jgi:nitroreductase
MDIYEVIALRKSVRDFNDKDVPGTILTRLLEGARMAASASNRQEWRYVVVKEPKTREQLGQAAFGQAHVRQAPVILVCCAETDEHVMPCNQPSYPIDVAIATTHITLCAAAEGLGTCWIGAFSEEKVKEIVNIPGRIRVVALMALGYPKNPGPVRKVRLPLEAIVKYERWQT